MWMFKEPNETLTDAPPVSSCDYQPGNGTRYMLILIHPQHIAAEPAILTWVNAPRTGRAMRIPTFRGKIETDVHYIVEKLDIGYPDAKAIASWLNTLTGVTVDMTGMTADMG